MPVHNAAQLPFWWVWPSTIALLLGIYGLARATGWAMRLFDPSENAFTIPASQAAFRFVLSKGGTYEIGCVRPNQFSFFQVPQTTLLVRRLPAGPEQQIHAGGVGWVKRTSMSGETTMRIGSFTAAERGEYELRNPGTAQFSLGDKLRIQPDTGFRMVLLILLFLVSGLATIGGLVLGTVALAGR